MSLIRKFKRAFSSTETYSAHFNTPIRFTQDDWFINERIVEIPFALNQIVPANHGASVLDFGCTRSTLVLQLASLGLNVTGIDLRAYKISHPNLTTLQGNIHDIDLAEQFDYVLSISVLEHVGLGAYGESKKQDVLDQTVSRLVSLLREGGKLIITVPTGEQYENEFYRSFTPEQVYTLFDRPNLELVTSQFYRREAFKYWEPCTMNQVMAVENSSAKRGPTGVNGVGCYSWLKTA